MNLNEVTDPAIMKLRLEVSRLRTACEDRDKVLSELVQEVASLKQTVTKLIRALGPKPK